MLACNMAEWRQFKNKQRQKRAAKGKRRARESVEAKDGIIVQRMSSEVTGKQQKYTRIGPREFVPFEFDDITFDNIVEACQKYFAAQIDKDMVCDILAGERGPSCKKMCQIDPFKVNAAILPGVQNYWGERAANHECNANGRLVRTVFVRTYHYRNSFSMRLFICENRLLFLSVV